MTTLTPTVVASPVISAGQDVTHGSHRRLIWGQFPLAIKLSGSATDGQALIFEHADMANGGPPRHVHHAQDEWFYVVKGEYRMEIGDAAHTLRAGDSLLAPRGIPHAWACISDEPGTLLTVVTPVGSFEEFITGTTEHADLPPMDQIDAALTAGGMTLLGPPLAV